MKTLLSVCFAAVVVYLVALGINTMNHDYETAVALAGPQPIGQTEAERACVLAGIIEDLELLTPAPDCEDLAYREAEASLEWPVPEGQSAQDRARILVDTAHDIMERPATQ